MNPASAPDFHFGALLLYCRPGFEKECAQEIAAACTGQSVSGTVRGKPEAGYVEFVPDDSEAVGRLRSHLRFEYLIFARQLIYAMPWIRDLPAADRIGALLPSIAAIGTPFGAVWLETADTNEAKELGAFCRKFAAPLTLALKAAALLREGAPGLPRLHLFFAGSTTVCIGISDPGNASPWTMGVPRLGLPPHAPSRSTQKLAEALHLWLTPEEDKRLLHEGTKAVDLGAAPGGWTWQLVRRGVQVIAVDNGPMTAKLLETGRVEQVRADGFRYRPPRPVPWMVCDMVEQPIRVAELVADWLADGRCAHSIFNLKLPMKRRYEELERCRKAMRDRWRAAGVTCELRFKHLYHDREEVTGYAYRVDEPRKKRQRAHDQSARSP
jgi:23S rRNA (cytidine2498-2'-O)-methyltransferase